MLILRRKSGESIVIGENINVTVLDINEGSVRLAIDAPKVIPILRSELLQAADANRDSAVTEQAQSSGLLQLLGGRSGDSPKAVRPKASRRGPFRAGASRKAQAAPDAVPQNAQTVSDNANAVPQNADAVQNAQTVSDDANAVQNAQTVSDNANAVPQNAETVPDNANAVPQNTDVSPDTNAISEAP